MPDKPIISIFDEEDGSPIPFREWYAIWQKEVAGTDVQYGPHWGMAPWYSEAGREPLMRFMDGVADYLDQLNAAKRPTDA